MSLVISAGECAAAVGGRLVAGREDLLFSSVSIDSRNLQPGALFFAIPGPRYDGHDFVAGALRQGASGAVVSRRVDIPEGRAQIEVSDTAQALLRLAAHHRRAWARRLACITGSTGKTTTKELLAQLLGETYAVYKSPGNFNNIYGLSQALLSLDERHQVAVVEIGMSAPGEIGMLAAAAAPEVGLLTNIEPVHLEFFPSVDAIAEAKGELLTAIRPGGTLVYNADDRRVAALAAGFHGHRVAFGFGADAQLAAVSVELLGLEGSRFMLRNRAQSQPVRLMLPGRHNIANFLAAAAASMVWGLSLEQVARSAARLLTEAHRGAVLRFEEGLTVVDDSYNSNPTALSCMLELLQATTGYRRKILVAGEMLELGAEGARYHRLAGRQAAEAGVDLLIAVRGEAREMAQGAAEAGMGADRVHFCADAAAACGLLPGLLREGDLVLVKGSHGVGLERLVAEICARFTRSGEQAPGDGKC